MCAWRIYMYKSIYRTEFWVDRRDSLSTPNIIHIRFRDVRNVRDGDIIWPNANTSSHTCKYWSPNEIKRHLYHSNESWFYITSPCQYGWGKYILYTINRISPMACVSVTIYTPHSGLNIENAACDDDFAEVLTAACKNITKLLGK